MHARVSIISGSVDRVGQGITMFQEQVVPAVKEMGGRGAIMLVDRESGTGMSITLWDDEASMRASEERANELRRQATEDMGGGEPRVERYEVAVFDV